MKKEVYSKLVSEAAIIRQLVLKMISAAGSGHTASSLGLTDLLTLLYFYVLKIRPDEPRWPDRDLFVMSNGHVAPLLYAVLARRGFFSEEELLSLRQMGSRLQGHPERGSVPGLETTSGPLGSGLSQASGMAYHLKFLQSNSDRRVFCLMGDGEIDEGNVWEAALFAAKYELDNLICFVDRNKIQLSGLTDEIMPLGNLREKWNSFGWCVQQVDGHDFVAMNHAIKIAREVKNRPNMIIINTVAGKGVDFMEDDYRWHGKAPNQEELARALEQMEDVK